MQLQHARCHKGGQHENQLINYLCLEDTCMNDRLLCRFCVRDQHRKHQLATIDKFIEPLARMNMNSRHHESEFYLNNLTTAMKQIYQVLFYQNRTWTKIEQIMNKHLQKIQQELIKQITNIIHTFTDESIEIASQQLLQNKINKINIEQYVSIINFLGKKDFNNPKLISDISICIKDNICDVLESTFQKIDKLLQGIHQHTKKYNFLNTDIDSITQEYLKNKNQSTQTNANNLVTDSKNIKNNNNNNNQNQNQNSINLIIDKSQTSVIQLPTTFETPQVKREQIEYQDFHNQTDKKLTVKINKYDHSMSNLSKQISNKVQKLILGYCLKVQQEVSLFLTNSSQIDQLEILWHPFAIKKYLLLYINNLPKLKIIRLNCYNEFDSQCFKQIFLKLPQLQILQYGWDFQNNLSNYDQTVYFRISTLTSRIGPLKTNITLELINSLNHLENIWIGDFNYFKSINCKVFSFKNLKIITLGEIKHKINKMQPKLLIQLKLTKQLICLTLFKVQINQKDLIIILSNNLSLKSFMAQNCQSITDATLQCLLQHCKLQQLCLRQSHVVGGPIWLMTTLKILILCECSEINEKIALQRIVLLKNLRYLNLYGSIWVNNIFIARLKSKEQIESLNLGRTSIDDDCQKDIIEMKNLKTLCIDGTKMNGKTIVKICQQIKKIQRLSLWSLDGDFGCGLISEQDINRIGMVCTNLLHLSIKSCKHLKNIYFNWMKQLHIFETDHQILSQNTIQELDKNGVRMILEVINIPNETQ